MNCAENNMITITIKKALYRKGIKQINQEEDVIPITGKNTTKEHSIHQRKS